LTIKTSAFIAERTSLFKQLPNKIISVYALLRGARSLIIWHLAPFEGDTYIEN